MPSLSREVKRPGPLPPMNARLRALRCCRAARPGYKRRGETKMSKALSAIHTHAFDFWLARTSVVAIVVLQLLLVNRLTFGPRWLAPTLELALLVPLSVATAWAQDQVVRATHEHHWHMIA